MTRTHEREGSAAARPGIQQPLRPRIANGRDGTSLQPFPVLLRAQ